MDRIADAQKDDSWGKSVYVSRILVLKATLTSCSL